MRKYIILVLLFGVAHGFLSAQSASDVYKYSKNNREYMTARVAAMGGAFTSLGADPSASMINPAGLGLYRSGELSATFSIRSIGVNNIATADNENYFNSSTATTNFNLNNLNAVFNAIDRSSGTFRSLNFAIGYNLNFVNTINVNSEVGSTGKTILTHFANQLRGQSVGNITNNGAGVVYNRVGPELWGAVNAFNNGKNSGTDFVIGTDGNGNYNVNLLAVNEASRFLVQKEMRTEGRLETYNFSTGMQLGDYINFGMSLGVTDYTYSTEEDYFEFALKDKSGSYKAMGNYEGRKIDGVSFDFRLGLIAEPVEGLRVGISYHAPRLTNIEESYFSDQEIEYYYDPNVYYVESALSVSKYNMFSPSKLLTGLSYVIKGIGIISVDYERVWYNAMRMSGIDGSDAVTSNIKDTYKPTDAVYVGAEVYVWNNIFLRGGYNFVTSPLQEHARSGNYDDSSWSATAGIGYRSHSFYADFAYIYSPSRSAESLYYSADYAPSSRDEIFSHIFSLTVGWKF